MPRYLVYIDAQDIYTVGDLLSVGVDGGSIDEFFTLTENGSPIVFEEGMVGDHDFCNGMAIRCAGITEE